jgi:DnaD/phage-associated family protein
MKFSLPGPETITLSGQNADKLLKLGDGDAALLYLYILKTRGQRSVSETAQELRRTDEEITASMNQLGKLGLIRCEDMTSEPEPPRVTIVDIKREMATGTAFYSLVQESQKCLGKILSSDDLSRLFGLYDSLRMPSEVILQLIGHCVAQTRRQYGEGRTPTMRYIEKAAYSWERDGINTLEGAEDYIKSNEERRSKVSETKKIMQIRDRDLTPSEKRYIDGWLALGFTPEVIGFAYDKTVLKTGKLAWSYMDSIVNSWHGKGIHTLDEIEQRDGKTSPPSNVTNDSAPDANDLARMNTLLDRIKQA